MNIKKRGIVLLSVPLSEALALPIVVEQTTSEPTPIWIIILRKMWRPILHGNSYVYKKHTSHI